MDVIAPESTLILNLCCVLCRHCLKDAVKEGGAEPFTRRHGMNLFDYMGRDPRFNDLFNKSMTSLSAINMPKIAQHYSGFSKAKTVVDLGGGVGETLKTILSKNPHIRGINYDLPHVIAAAPPIPGKIDPNVIEGFVCIRTVMRARSTSCFT